jgi:hypothetical protein
MCFEGGSDGASLSSFALVHEEVGRGGRRLSGDPQLVRRQQADHGRFPPPRDHAEGIFMAEIIFGPTITLSSNRAIPTRWVGEHVIEDLGFIPSFGDW